MKQLRQRAIRDLVEQRPIRTQQELAAALRERGFRTTQATISRDVAELGLIKVHSRGDRGLRAAAAADRGRDLRRGPPAQAPGRPPARDPRGRPAAGPAHAARLRARHRGRARPGALAGGRGLDRGRRHALRRAPGPRLAAADQAPTRAPVGGRSAAAVTIGRQPAIERSWRFDSRTAPHYHSGPVGTSGARTSLRGTPGVLSFI